MDTNLTNIMSLLDPTGLQQKLTNGEAVTVEEAIHGRSVCQTQRSVLQNTSNVLKDIIETPLRAAAQEQRQIEQSQLDQWYFGLSADEKAAYDQQVAERVAREAEETKKKEE